MTFYRALLLAGAVVVGASAAYADDGRKDIQLRDEGLPGYNAENYANYGNEESYGNYENYEPSAPLYTGRASATEPAGVDVEDTDRDVPQSLRKADKAYEGNDN